MAADCNIQPPAPLVEETVHRELVMAYDGELVTVQDKGQRPGGREVGRRVGMRVDKKVGGYSVDGSFVRPATF